MERVILEYVANSVWQVPLLAGIAWLAILLAKPDARTQYRLWVMTLALAVALPMARPGILSPRVQMESVSSGAATMQLPRIAATASQMEGHPTRIVAVGSEQRDRFDWLPSGTIPLSGSAMDWLVGAYFFILLLRLLQLARARRSANALLRGAMEAKLSTAERRILQACCERLNVREPRIFVSAEVWSPMTVGSLRPALLLPENFRESTEAEKTAVLYHELAHIRRRDLSVNWICQVGSLPMAYHPIGYGVNRQIRRTRELACDAMAAAAMESSVGYAGCLVSLAQRMHPEAGRACAVESAGLFDHDVLEERIMRLLENKEAVSLRMKFVRAAGASALILGMTAAVAAFHVTPVVRAAQNAAPPPVTKGAPLSPAIPDLRIAVPVNLAVPVKVPASIAVPAEIAIPVHIAVPAPLAIPVHIAMPARIATAVHISSPVEAGVVAPPIQAAVPPVPPMQATVPSAAPSTPAKPSAIPKPQSSVHNRAATGEAENFHLTPKEQARIDREMAAATARIQAETKRLQGPEFKRQMAEMQAQVAEATKKMQSDEVQRQLKMLQSPEFKRQMADMQAQVAEATKKMQSDEVQRQLKILQGPEFKKQMADMQRQIAEAARKLQNDDMQRKIQKLQQREGSLPHPPSKAGSTPQ